MATSIKPSSLLISLKKVVEETSTYTGQEFFKSLVKNLAEVLGVFGVWVTEYFPEKNRLRAIAFWMDGKFIEDYEYDVKGTACEQVIHNDQIFHVPDRLIELFPTDLDLPPESVSYLGLALKAHDSTVLGHISILDKKPMPAIPEFFTLFRLFAERAASELRRMNYEKMIIESEARLSRLFDGAWEAILELDTSYLITQANRSAIRIFGTEHLPGMSIKELFDVASLEKITASLYNLQQQKAFLSSAWIQGQLQGIKTSGEIFTAEMTLSRYQYRQKDYFAVFIRSMEGLAQVKKELKNLHVEATMLREKVNNHEFNNIIGESPQIAEALDMVQKVALSQVTVLIQGETGTGKELFAKAIHNASRRKNKTLVTLNCAALPAELIESELFGHVKGAFTGAHETREGRFSLAHEGTLFLDEIGELSLTVQAKLLRVLQEGEFEPVGSSVTQKVNVRVIAATHRNLQEKVAGESFRQDLYYRLNVFPIVIPPLRERGEDVVLIAEALIKKISAQTGRQPTLLSQADKNALLSYSWPGNVRELQNIIERAVIISREGSIDLSALLPTSIKSIPETIFENSKILTEEELKNLERQNILKALETCGWIISGEKGAAHLLKIPPTTLTARMQKMKIKKTMQ